MTQDPGSPGKISRFKCIALSKLYCSRSYLQSDSRCQVCFKENELNNDFALFILYFTVFFMVSGLDIPVTLISWRMVWCVTEQNCQHSSRFSARVKNTRIIIHCYYAQVLFLVYYFKYYFTNIISFSRKKCFFLILVVSSHFGLPSIIVENKQIKIMQIQI